MKFPLIASAPAPYGLRCGSDQRTSFRSPDAVLGSLRSCARSVHSTPSPSVALLPPTPAYGGSWLGRLEYRGAGKVTTRQVHIIGSKAV